MRLLVICLVFACAQVSGQVLLKINDAPPRTLAAKDLAGLPRHAAVLNEHGQQRSYEGVLLHDVLVYGGLDFGNGLRGKKLSSYVTATGSDGYEVVYAVAEFDPTIMDSGILVADTRDGKPLVGDEGPLRIVVPHDERPARCVRMLKEIEVVQLNK